MAAELKQPVPRLPLGAVAAGFGLRDEKGDNAYGSLPPSGGDADMGEVKFDESAVKAHLSNHSGSDDNGDGGGGAVGGAGDSDMDEHDDAAARAQAAAARRGSLGSTGTAGTRGSVGLDSDSDDNGDVGGGGDVYDSAYGMGGRGGGSAEPDDDEPFELSTDRQAIGSGRSTTSHHDAVDPSVFAKAMAAATWNGGKPADRCDDDPYTRVRRALLAIDATVAHLLTASRHLPASMCTELRSMGARADAFAQFVARRQAEQSRVVSQLLDLHRLPAGSFDNANPRVRYYRAAALATNDHRTAADRFTAWHMPQYLSSQPLPPLPLLADPTKSGTAGVAAASAPLVPGASLVLGGRRSAPRVQPPPPPPSAGALLPPAPTPSPPPGASAGGHSVSAVVRLPPGANPMLTHTRIGIGERDTVAGALRLLWGKCTALPPLPGAGAVEDAYVLKVVGRVEYLADGPRRLFEYAYIRQSVRDGRECNLAMVPRPLEARTSAAARANNARADALEREYVSAVDPTVRVLTPGQYTVPASHFAATTNAAASAALGSAGPVDGPHWSERTSIALYDQVGVPFRVRLVGLDGLHARLLPRLGAKVPAAYHESGWAGVGGGGLAAPGGGGGGGGSSGSGSNSGGGTTWRPDQLMVEVVLFNGDDVLKDARFATPAFTATGKSQRLMHWCPSPCTPFVTSPPQGLMLANIPRTTRLAVLLYGTLGATTHTHSGNNNTASSSSGQRPVKRVLVAWVILPLVDETGTLVTGTHTLRLWACPTFGNAKKSGGGRGGTGSAAGTPGSSPRRNPYNVAGLPMSPPKAAHMPLPGGVHDTVGGGGGGGDEHKRPRDITDVGDEFMFRAPPYPLFSSSSSTGAGGEPSFASVTLHFPEFALPVVAPLADAFREPNPALVGVEVPVKLLSMPDRKLFDTLLLQHGGADGAGGSHERLTADQKRLVWQMRHSLVRYPRLLPKLIQSADWTRRDFAHETHRLLDRWAPPFQPQVQQPHQSQQPQQQQPQPQQQAVGDVSGVLELLDARYSDYRVRCYALNWLSRLDDHELSLYVLQLVQCVKFEAYHHSELSAFLVRRALRAPYVIGHPLFWHIKSEMAWNPYFRERYALILEEYLSFSRHHPQQLLRQTETVARLQAVSELVVRLKRQTPELPDATVKARYRDALEQLNRDFLAPQLSFQMPFDPKLEATTLLVDQCRYMSSKMVPLWLAFRNVDDDAPQQLQIDPANATGGAAATGPRTPPILVLFKSGDDLRQDILTLQLLKVMDNLWLRAGLDLRLTPYSVLGTGVNGDGLGVGLLEVVPRADTTSSIQSEFGGGAMGALKSHTLDAYLRAHNSPVTDRYDRAVDNFVRSCAGYCVATYVLGVGDRHNGNIMVTKSGHLFHIDFGHILGNFKSKFGINRERAAFVFTPEMAYVMGGSHYKQHRLFRHFQTLSAEAYHVLRRHAALLQTLFVLLVPAGMPELLTEGDIRYLRDKLAPGVADAAATKQLTDEIDKSLDSTYRRIDNMIHIAKHG